MTDPRLNELLEAWRQADGEDERTTRKRAIREHLAPVAADPDPDREALEQAAAVLDSDPAEAERIVRAHFAPAPSVLDAAPLAAAQGQPIPEPIIQRAHCGTRVDAVVSVGEPGLLTGAGSSGKSFLSLALARAAAVAHADGNSSRKVCGLEVAAGPSLIVSYEYGRRRGWHRMKAVDDAAKPHPAAFNGVHLVDAPGPLYVADHRAGGVVAGDTWAPVWEYAQRIDAKLLVIDSGGLALEGAGVSEDRPVKVFLRALARESEASGCGVLVITHSNKAARKAGEAADDADIAAGSAAWFDQARGVLMLSGDATGGPGGRKLQARKCNEGRSEWGAYLKVMDGPNGDFGGFGLAKAISAEGETDGAAAPALSGQV